MVRAWIYAYNLFLLGCKVWTFKFYSIILFYLSHAKNIFMDDVGDFVFFKFVILIN
jgi:hypothetical protein